MKKLLRKLFKNHFERLDREDKCHDYERVLIDVGRSYFWRCRSCHKEKWPNV